MSKVSIVIPAYNAEKYIQQTVDSVLTQTYPNFEIIVVNDGSTDSTAQILAEYGNKIHYIYQQNKGLSGARNTGFLATRGEYLLFLDSDDLILPDKLDLQVSFLTANPQFALVYSAWQYINKDASCILGEIRPHKQGHLLKELLNHTFYISTIGTVLIRRECLEKVGLFDTSLKRNEDFDLWLRLSRAGYAFGYIDLPLLQYRIHQDSLSTKVATALQFNFKVLDKFFSDPNLPVDTKRLKPEAYKVLHLEGAARYYRRGQVDAGSKHLRQAFGSPSSLQQIDEDRFLEWLAAAALDVRVTEPHQFIDLVFDHLPADLANLQFLRRKAHGRYHIAAAFAAYNKNQPAETRRHIIPGLRQDPSIICNRGFVNISLRSLLGN